MSCLIIFILYVEIPAVEVDAHRDQHTQANLDGLRWYEAYCQLPLYDLEKEVQHCHMILVTIFLVISLYYCIVY